MRLSTLSLIILPGLALGQTLQPMAIPPLLDADTFHLTVAAHTHQFYPGKNTPTYGVNGPYLGPTLLLHQGDTARIVVENQLNEVTTMHWHGMHVPGEMDGGPQSIIGPGNSWMAEYMVKNPAGTYWYHPHPHMLTAKQANLGISGLIIVQDGEEAQLDLPRTYGEDDFPVVLQDKKWIANGEMALYPLGDSMLVNGTPNAMLEVPAQVVRLRVLNGAVARIFNLGFDDGRDFTMIASDAGLLPAPVSINRLLLSNGERAELLLDLSGMEGDTLTLMSYGDELTDPMPGSGNLILEGSFLNGVAFPMLRLVVGPPTANPVTAIPATLVTHTPPDEGESVRTRIKTLTGTGMVAMGQFRINGLLYDMDVVNDTIILGSTEVWHFVNNTNLAHPMHLHGVSFYVLERNGQAPPAWEQGPKDVVLVDQGEDVKLIAYFGEPAGADFPFMYHCHNLMHEDHMMMLQMMVVDPQAAVRGSQRDASHVYPSPTTGLVRYDVEFPVEHLRIRDAMGRVVLDQARGPFQGTIDLSEMARGVYLLEIVGHGQRSLARVVKE
ncbi:MAG: multicopper oxidase domain-containing protein [Flavobacteriales bacterium]|nr:multicopper oxidase domain-containing protein [Flavobacteriales bacterium]MEB2342446.1 multicopper oxidase domain-containing protein [Flavobacteriia bacterium]